MKRALVAAALAGSICCLSVPLLAQDQQTDPTNSELQANAAPTDPSFEYPPFRVRIVEPPEETEARERREQESNERERRDMDAQELVARKTEELTYVAWVQLVLSAIGFGALFYTLYLTRRATQSAEAANAISADTAKRQLRAYLSVTIARFVSGTTGEMIGAVQIDNTGQTPGEILECSCIAQFDRLRPVAHQTGDIQRSHHFGRTW